MVVDHGLAVAQTLPKGVALADPRRQCFGPVESEHAPAARFGVEAVGKVRLDAGGLVEEGQRLVPRLGQIRQAEAVLLGLMLHSAEGRPRLFGLHRPDGFAIHAQQVIGDARFQMSLSRSIIINSNITLADCRRPDQSNRQKLARWLV